MFESFRLSNLPGYAKLFVALFTALMLCVCFWASWLFAVEKGVVAKQDAEMNIPQKPVDPDIKQFLTDSSEVLAPIWDSTHAGEEERPDSAALVKEMRTETKKEEKRPPNFGHNLRLAHTHINGQTLLFFAIGLLFISTSAKPQLKKALLWVFGISVLAHNIGLTGAGYASMYDDVLAISGVLLLVCIVYMAFLIFVDLAKSPKVSEK